MATLLAHLPYGGTVREQEERVRVLVVDDEPNDLRYIRDTLAKSGYEPVVTGEPEEALALMAKGGPGPGPSGPGPPGHGRHPAHGGYPERGGRAHHLPVRPQARRPHRQGLRHGRSRLRRQALLPHGAFGQDQGGPPPARRIRAAGAVHVGRPDHRVPGAQSDRGGPPGAADPEGVRACSSSSR